MAMLYSYEKIYNIYKYYTKNITNNIILIITYLHVNVLSIL